MVEWLDKKQTVSSEKYERFIITTASVLWNTLFKSSEKNYQTRAFKASAICTNLSVGCLNIAIILASSCTACITSAHTNGNSPRCVVVMVTDMICLLHHSVLADPSPIVVKIKVKIISRGRFHAWGPEFTILDTNPCLARTKGLCGPIEVENLKTVSGC